MSATPPPAAAEAATDEKPEPKKKVARTGLKGSGTQTKADARLGWMMLAPAVLLTAVVLVYPMLVAVRQSFFSINTVTRAERWVGLTNYAELIVNYNFWASMGRTVYWVIGAMLSQAVVGIAVALGLHAKIRGRTQIRGAVLFPYLVPAIIAVLTWRWIFSDTVGVFNYITNDVLGLGKLGWFDPEWAMISVIVMSLWKYLPYWALFVLARLQTIPVELYEAASIDGATSWQRFRYITLPWIMPVVMVLLVLRSIWAFREFDMVYLPFGGGPLRVTTTIAVYIRDLAFNILDIGRAASAAMLMLIIVAALTQFYFWFYQRSEQTLD
ncbi:MAG: sugar ABC transporter permease [Nitriliruptoraceae bacterium]